MYIILAVIIFGILIATHELGHFLAAKISGVRVLEFAIGMGPVLLSRQGRETKYSLRALPLGGFCAMEGEDERSDDPRAFTNQRGWKKFIILAAGAAMNFLLGFLLILLVFARTDSFTTPTITGFMDGCPYEGADKLLEGDTFYKIDGERIYFSSDVSTYLQRGNGETADLVVVRDGKKVALEDFPIALVEYQTDEGAVMKYGLFFGVRETGLGAVLKYSWYSACDMVRLVRLGLTDLLTGALGLRDMSGVIGIVDVINDVGRTAPTVADALYNIAYLSAFIAVNLAVMNLLPVPALDGGRILFLFLTWVVEKLSRRKLDPKYEGYVNTACFVLLMGLMVVIMFNDVYKIVVSS